MSFPNRTAISAESQAEACHHWESGAYRSISGLAKCAGIEEVAVRLRHDMGPYSARIGGCHFGWEPNFFARQRRAGMTAAERAFDVVRASRARRPANGPSGWIPVFSIEPCHPAALALSAIMNFALRSSGEPAPVSQTARIL